MNQRVAVVLVTFNRLEKLKIALDSYEKQIYPIEAIIVVDNCSTDGTAEYLKGWENKKGVTDRYTLFMSENTGGAGGFGSGMEYALKKIDYGHLSANWIMVSDDDAYPDPDAIERLVNYYEKQNDDTQRKIVALSSSVINNGKIHEDHRSRIKRGKFRVRFIGVPKEEYDKEAFEIDLFSYVGTMIKVSILRKAGTTNKELFIYGDDNEHSLRVCKYGKILVVPESKYIHDTPGVETRAIGWPNYYNRRNQLYILKMYFPKRYLYLRMIKRMILDESILSKYTRKERALFKAARKDAMSSCLGKHPLYSPGFRM